MASSGTVITWVSAFLDLPAASWERGVAFWRAVTGTSLSATRGSYDEFATFVPSHGEPFLRVQRTGGARPGLHLDLHLDAGSFAVRRSPGGFAYCLNERAGGARPAPVNWGGYSSLVDQVCLDIPPAEYDEECAFWAEATGWELAPTSVSYLRQLVRPEGMPFRILLQRRDEGEPPVTAHLDLATTDRAAEVARHVALGAEVDGDGSRWTRLRDPIGLLYCVTDRDPVTGRVPA